jgi:hypothetical protein
MKRKKNYPPNQERTKKKSTQVVEMPKYGTYLQKEAYYLFDKQEQDMNGWSKCSFDIALDDKNEMYIMGKDVVKKMNEIKETLEEIVEEWEEYEEEDGESYMIFYMGDYMIKTTNFENEEYRDWVYEYEIDDYYDLIIGKLCEYNILVKVIEDEKAKIQMEKDVCVGVSLALLSI